MGDAERLKIEGIFWFLRELLENHQENLLKKTIRVLQKNSTFFPHLPQMNGKNWKEGNKKLVIILNSIRPNLLFVCNKFL